MVGLVIDNDFLLAPSLGHVIAQTPADTTAGADRDKPILRTGVERVLAVDKFRVQHHIALLAGVGDQVRQAFPGDQVLCAGDAALGRRC